MAGKGFEVRIEICDRVIVGSDPRRKPISQIEAAAQIDHKRITIRVELGQHFPTRFGEQRVAVPKMTRPPDAGENDKGDERSCECLAPRTDEKFPAETVISSGRIRHAVVFALLRREYKPGYDATALVGLIA